MLNKDFYPDTYLAGGVGKFGDSHDTFPAGHQGGKLRVTVIPEIGDDGDFTPCAYIRLLLPLDYLHHLGLIRLTVASKHTAHLQEFDLLFCQRTSSCDLGEAESILASTRNSGKRLFYDIDDNLLDIDESHPEYRALSRNASVVRAFLEGASAVFCSTEELKKQLLPQSTKSFVLRNALDQRLISPRGGRSDIASGKAGILYMGTQTHNSDFDLIATTLSQIIQDFGDRVRVGIIGVTTNPRLPSGVERVAVPSSVGSSYPAFMTWLSRQSSWNIGLSPLVDTGFNRAKSEIKALDYMSMGAVSIVSNVTAYRNLPDQAVVKVENTPSAWYRAIASQIEAPDHLTETARSGHELLLQRFTLEAQLSERIRVLRMALNL